MDRRVKVANEIINILKDYPEVNDVFIRGSLSKKSHIDKYSDIDIGIDVSGLQCFPGIGKSLK
ncbi:hypothetical protein E3U55_15940 [Filobacillus milosensis]|uniref:Nucleotidyltransferase domain-containing protein n=1 Tax=Filobacillus milosensis TaxID=94137 RepID=A0A4Y8IC47_9BACI|nr:hypothetical protein [Filobacillus milosensis]TFB13463.1 hypothetical protein E3U55_15940 [Filobacillus milosensis]